MIVERRNCQNGSDDEGNEGGRERWGKNFASDDCF